MENLEKLYDAFGELIYVVAMADGIIQDKEYETLEKILDKHPWAKQVKWSFDYEKDHNNSIEYLYKRVIEICHDYGPREEYQYLLDVLIEIASSSSGLNESERAIINKFSKDLTEWFKRDLDSMDK